MLSLAHRLESAAVCWERLSYCLPSDAFRLAVSLLILDAAFLDQLNCSRFLAAFWSANSRERWFVGLTQHYACCLLGVCRLDYLPQAGSDCWRPLVRPAKN